MSDTHKCSKNIPLTHSVAYILKFALRKICVCIENQWTIHSNWKKKCLCSHFLWLFLFNNICLLLPTTSPLLILAREPILIAHCTKLISKIRDDISFLIFYSSKLKIKCIKFLNTLKSIIDFFIFKICMPLIFILKNRHILKLNLELLALNIILFFLKVYCWNVGIWKTSWNPSASWKESLLSILWKICILNGDQFQKSEK